jgi:nitrite reductase/ring-hydroxylating ferredoxin subunit
VPRSTDRSVRIEQLPDEQVLVSVGDRQFVVAAACPHRKGRLAYAHVNAGSLRIVCPLHRSSYDLDTGRRLSGPAADDLPVRERAARPERPC